MNEAIQFLSKSLANKSEGELYQILLLITTSCEVKVEPSYIGNQINQFMYNGDDILKNAQAVYDQVVYKHYFFIRAEFRVFANENEFMPEFDAFKHDFYSQDVKEKNESIKNSEHKSRFKKIKYAKNNLE